MAHPFNGIVFSNKKEQTIDICNLNRSQRHILSEKKKSQSMLERVYRKGNPPILLVGMETGTATMENSMQIPLKTKIRATI